LLFTYTVPWAALCLLLARGTTWAWVLFAAAVILRMTMTWASVVSVLKDKVAMQSLWLLPVRDFLAAFVWIAGMFGSKIVWRGQEFKLENGKLKRT
jgi:ceramide glucosyltransferase